MEDITNGSSLDRISDLPSNVTDIILGYLPLKDAVRTSSLSKMWKEKWHHIPYVVFDEKMFEGKTFKRERSDLEGIVNYILTTHEGSIEKFSVSVEVTDNYNINSWLRRVKGVEELSLLYRRQRKGLKELPSTVFSYQQLRKLNLRRCAMKPPYFFTGFQSLIGLQLNKVGIETAALEKLISSCPLLEQLTLKGLSCGDIRNIDVPKLKYFSFDGEIDSFCFNTPFLEVFSIKVYELDRYRRKNSSSYKFAGLPSTIKELYVRDEFHEYMAACDIFNEVSTYSQLRTLQLTHFCSEKLDQVQCLLMLIGTAPNLTKIDISMSSLCGRSNPEALTKFWKEQNNAPLISNPLQKVRMWYSGRDAEMEFIHFVTANSPMLEELTIEYWKKPHFNEHETKEVLQALCKASTQLKFGAEKDDDDSNRSVDTYPDFYSRDDKYQEDSD